MSKLMVVKALSGFNYIRADMVVAIAAAEASKCTIYLMGGITIHSSEPAKDIIERLEALAVSPTDEAKKEPD